jgi:hypothetical protein
MKKSQIRFIAIAIVGAAVLLLLNYGRTSFDRRRCVAQNAEKYQTFFESFFNQLGSTSAQRHMPRRGSLGAADSAPAEGIHTQLEEVLRDLPPMGVHNNDICAYGALPTVPNDPFPCETRGPKPSPIVASTVSPTVSPKPSPTPPACLRPCMIVASPSPSPIPTPTPIGSARNRIIKAGKAVARLEIVAPAGSFSNLAGPATGSEEHYLWGTAVMVDVGVAATSCHAIEPLVKMLNGKLDLSLDKDQRLLIDFGENSRDHLLNQEFEVDHLLACSDTEGLDVALLQVHCIARDKSTTLDPGNKITLDTNPPPADPEPATMAAIVGYADLDHPLDNNTDQVYSSYKGTRFAKFVSLDFVVGTNHCIDKPKILLDTGTTTIGESGAVVLRLPRDSSDSSELQAIGFHTCCSAYFGESSPTPPHEKLPCSRLERTVYNQAVSSWSVLQDEHLGSVLKHPLGCGTAK